MIATIECLRQTCIDISDNCSCQYKYAEHFGDLQEICVETGIPFSIAGYDKGEVDHVEGLAKCSICGFFGMGGRVFYAMGCKDYLISKFGNKTTPAVLVKELKMEELSDLHVEARLKKYPTIDGSDSFQVMVFKPNSSFKAVSCLCVCDSCLIEYGSCPFFTEYQFQTCSPNKIYLWYVIVESNVEKENNSNASEEFFLPDSYWAVAPDSSSPDSIWFVKIIDALETNVEITDDYENTISPG